jgi:hypothetical protein
MTSVLDSFFSGGFERCGSVCEKDFSFISRDFEHHCSRFTACFLSPRVCEALRADSSIDSFYLEYDGDDVVEILQHLESFMRGEPIPATETIEPGLWSVSALLGNQNLINCLIRESEPPALNTICRRLQYKIAVGQCDPSEIAFAALHFFEIDQDELRTFPVSILEEILSNESLQLKTEDSLLKFICSVDCDRRLLLRNVKTEYLSRHSLEILLSYFDGDSIDGVRDDLVISSSSPCSFCDTSGFRIDSFPPLSRAIVPIRSGPSFQGNHFVLDGDVWG